MKAKIFSTILIFICLSLTSARPQSDTLQVVDTAGDIGSVENTVPVVLINNQVVRGLQLKLYFNTNLEYSRVENTPRTTGFTVYPEIDNLNGILQLVLVSLDTNRIFPGTGEILNVKFNVKPNAVPGNYPLNLADIVASNSFYESIPMYGVNGLFTVEGGVIPVELASFKAEYNRSNHAVKLQWTTLSEKDNYGFEVQRDAGNNDFEKIGFVSGLGSYNTPQTYSFVDDDVALESYRYRLKQIDLTGSFQFSPVVTVKIDAPQTFSLAQNYPNPFSLAQNGAKTVIRFELPTAANVEIKIFDILGREVRRLVSGKQTAGVHRIHWDGTDGYGNPVSAGIYFYQMETAKFNDIKKLLILE
ncbi:MAG: T9SS type A sorting domain-containing protein [Calditrichaeota bacterium]|nr:T9SS type A sorting domain-containing protein [Calditrichota bacterium]